MGYRHFNPNPLRSRVGDCAVRAICMATDCDWDTAYAKLVAMGYQRKDLPDANNVWGAVLRSEGFHRDIMPDTCPDCYTVADFCKDHPKGTYVLALRDHVVTVVDGHHFDTWDSAGEVVLYFWYKEEKEKNEL